MRRRHDDAANEPGGVFTRASRRAVSRTAWIGAALLVAAAGPRAQQRQVFRGGTTAVAVDVSVNDGRRAVLGLTADDFILRDNLVPQQIEAASLENLPFDLTLVVDTSGSLAGKAFEQFKADIATIGGMLGEQDRFRVVTVATRAVDAFGWRPGALPPPTARLATGGATAFYQALAAVLLRGTEPGRRQLIVAMSDGFDNVSWNDAGDVRELARMSDAVLHIVIRRNSRNRLGAPTWGWVPYSGPGDTDTLEAAAEATGGRLRTASDTESLTDAFRTALDEFRRSYVLWYTPAHVPPDGWHSIDIRVKQGDYTIRARSGYFAGREPR